MTNGPRSRWQTEPFEMFHKNTVELDYILSFILFLYFLYTTIWASQVIGISGKEPTWQCKRCKRYGFAPWVRKIPWRRTWQPIPIFLPEEHHGQQSRPPPSIGSPRVSPNWVCVCLCTQVLTCMCTHTHTHPSSILAPGPSWWLFSSKGWWGVCPLLVSLVTDEPTCSQFPFLLEASLPATMFCPTCSPLRSLGCHARALLQTCKLLHPLNHWCLCRQL